MPLKDFIISRDDCKRICDNINDLVGADVFTSDSDFVDDEGDEF